MRHLKCTRSAGVLVGVTRVRRAVPHMRGSRKSRGGARGARGREGLRRSFGEVWREAATVILVVVA